MPQRVALKLLIILRTILDGAYENQMKFFPPPLTMVIFSIIEVVFFVVDIIYFKWVKRGHKAFKIFVILEKKIDNLFTINSTF